MPLPLNPGPDQSAIEVKFRPWIAQSANPARMSALWKGVGAFAKFLGPVGAIGSLLLDAKKEDPTLWTQAKASFFDKTGLDPQTEADVRRAFPAYTGMLVVAERWQLAVLFALGADESEAGS